jgi:hypothetical protein
LHRSTHISAYGIEYQKKFTESKGLIKSFNASANKKSTRRSNGTYAVATASAATNPYQHHTPGSGTTLTKRARKSVSQDPMTSAAIAAAALLPDYTVTRSGRLSKKTILLPDDSNEFTSNGTTTHLLPSSTLPSSSSSSGMPPDADDDSVQLPSTLAPLPHLPNLLTYDENLLNPSDSFYFCCLDVCCLCSSYGSIEHMLFCSDCGECFHTFCIQSQLQLYPSKYPNFNLSSIQQFAYSATQQQPQTQQQQDGRHGNGKSRFWRCLNCNKCCQQCHKSSCDVSCKVCNASYHLNCLSPKPRPSSSTHLLRNKHEFICEECMEGNCITCDKKLKSYSLTQMNPHSTLSLEYFIGKNYFQNRKRWGVKDKCLECICSELSSFYLVSYLFDLPKRCHVCHKNCILITPSTSSTATASSSSISSSVSSSVTAASSLPTRESKADQGPGQGNGQGEDDIDLTTTSITAARQCFGCFHFFHLKCCEAASHVTGADEVTGAVTTGEATTVSSNEEYDLQTLYQEFLCLECSVEFFAKNKTNSSKNIDVSVYQLMNRIQLQRLHNLNKLRTSIVSKEVNPHWNLSFSASLHAALVIWATRRFQALSLYGGPGPIILTDNSRFKIREYSTISSNKIITKAKKFCHLCRNQTKISQLLSGTGLTLLLSCPALPLTSRLSSALIVAQQEECILVTRIR